MIAHGWEVAMRRLIQILFLLAVGSAPIAAAASGGGAVKKGPKGIPFSCSDARTLRVVYDGGGMRAKVKLMFANGETHELKAAPTPIGRRYTKPTGEGRLMVWKTNGVDAEIAEAGGALSGSLETHTGAEVHKASLSPASPEEHVVARCHRARSAEHEGKAHEEGH
jgi:hypothetical protein